MVRSKSAKRFEILAHTVMIFITVCIVLPFILLFMSSITSETALVRDGYSFSFYVFFTMLFNGGLVPTYLMYTGIFHINNTLLAYIVPGFLMSAMNVMLIRTFFANSIPDALFEAAQIDGASQFQIFGKIVLPLGKPILVAMGLLSGLGYWNDWTNGLYYVRDTQLYGIQNLLNKMITDLTALTQNASGASTAALAEIPSASVRMAIAFVAMLPILCLYPFLQKYFTKGIALGAVKG